MKNHQEIVKKILDSKAVDFEAIGKVIAEIGPSVSMTDEPWENFCLTMRHFMRFYIINPFPFPNPFPNPIEQEESI